MRAELETLSPTNAEWRRSWHMRMCTDASQAGRYVLTVHGSHAMAKRRHTGVYTLRLVTLIKYN